MDDTLHFLSLEEKKAFFKHTTITHRLLEQTHRTIMRTVCEPADITSILVHGPTGVGKTRMIESLVNQIREQFLKGQKAPEASSFPYHGLVPLSIPVLLLEAQPPDGNAFDRGYFYQTVLTLLGERTYPQQSMHVDIHAEAAASPPKRRRLTRAETAFHDVPEWREATENAMRRHEVRVVILDEAQHMLYGKNGMGGSTLQEQVEWLKSLSSKTGVS